MIKRIALPLVLLLCGVPGVGSAQLGSSPSPRVTITPYTGVRVPFGRSAITVFLPRDTVSVYQERGGNPLLGMEARVGVRGRVGLVAAAATSRTGEARYSFTPFDTVAGQQPDLISYNDAQMWFARVGVSALFEGERTLQDTRPRPSTELVAGAAMVHEFGSDHPALNLGFKGSLPLARGVELAVGLEDYLVFWDRAGLAPTLKDRLGRFPAFQGKGAEFRVDYGTSNIVHLRVGLTLAPQLW